MKYEKWEPDFISKKVMGTKRSVNTRNLKFTSAKAKELGNLIKSQKEIREDRKKMKGNPRLKTQRGKEIERWESNKPEGFDALLSKGKPYHDVSDHYGILGTFINWSKSDKKANRRKRGKKKQFA